MRLPKFILGLAILAASAVTANAYPPVVRTTYPVSPVPYYPIRTAPYYPIPTVTTYPVRPIYSPRIVVTPTYFNYRSFYLPYYGMIRSYDVYCRAYPLQPWTLYGSYASWRQANLIRDELILTQGM